MQASKEKNETRFAFYYFILVLFLGSVFYAPWVLSSYGRFPSGAGMIFVVLGGLSPTLAAVILTSRKWGKSGLQALFSQFGRRGFSKRWLLAAIGIPFIMSVLSFCLWLLFESTSNVYSLAFSVLVTYPIIFLSSFLMNMWEEVGWRGFALPKLTLKYGILVSSLLVGLVWAFWHWPQFLMKDSAMLNNYHNFGFFVVFTVLISFVYSWVFDASKGSLLTVSILHSSINTINAMLFFTPVIAFAVFPYYLGVTAMTTLLAIYYLRKKK